jgi:hypothetical protein
MVATNSLIRAVALLCLMGFTNAGPAMPLPRQTTAPSATTTTTSSNSTPSGPSIIATETNLAGAINGCTSVSLIVQIGPGPSSSVSTDTICIGSRYPISTNAAVGNAFAAGVSASRPVSVPASGCAIGTKNDGSNQGYCTCAGSGSASASNVSTILGYYRRNLTTACDTGAGSLPTNYVEVPEITDQPNGGTHPTWANPPSDSVAGNCTTAETLDIRCWVALDMDEYVKWWVSNRESHLFPISPCFGSCEECFLST